MPNPVTHCHLWSGVCLGVASKRHVLKRDLTASSEFDN